MKVYIVCPENPPCGSNEYSAPGEYYVAVSEEGELLNAHISSTKAWAEHDLLFSGEPTLYSILKEQYDEIEILFLGEDNMTYERLIELNEKYRKKNGELNGDYC